jgi:hypothetical protein
MTFVEMISDPRCRDLLICATAAEFVHGTVGLDGRAGWARPERFLPEQLRSLGSCVAWHPGLYKQMARTAAGVCVEFDTDSSEVALELRTPGLSASARSLVDPTLLAQPSFDGVACEVDTELLPLSWGIAWESEEERARRKHEEAVWGHAISPSQTTRLVSFSLLDDDELPAEGVLPLPGLGATHHVRLWLPCLHEVELRQLWGDGTFFLSCEERPRLLVLGDGEAQSVTGDAPCSWPVALAQGLGLDLLNQSLARQVFQPSALAGIERLDNVAAVVALGEAYRHERYRMIEVAPNISNYLRTLRQAYPTTPIWIVRPETLPEGEGEQADERFGEVVSLMQQEADALDMVCESLDVLQSLSLSDQRNASRELTS